MITLRRGTLLALASAGVLLAACGDDDNNSPSNTGTQFTAAEKSALGTAFTNTGLIPNDPTASELYGVLLGGVKSYGKITIPAALRAAPTSGLRLASIDGQYDATGLQYLLNISVNGQPSVVGLSAGILAWSGLNVQASTVNDWISIGANDDTATEFPTEPISGVVPDDVDAEYYLASNEMLYEGISGNASITSSTFGSSTTDCSVDIPNVGRLNCSYRYGSMQGSFDFVGAPISGSGENVTFANTSYDLPAVRVTLSGDFTVNTAVQAEALKGALRKVIRAR